MAGVLSLYDGCEGLVLDVNEPHGVTHPTGNGSGKCLEKGISLSFSANTVSYRLQKPVVFSKKMEEHDRELEHL